MDFTTHGSRHIAYGVRVLTKRFCSSASNLAHNCASSPFPSQAPTTSRIKNCGAINVEFYTGIGTVLPDPELLPPEMDMAYLDGRRVLLVDDVADSGRTLDLAVRLLTDRGAIVRSVVIYTKPTTIIRPDWSWKDTDLWIDFPWSWQGSVIEQDAAVRESA